jgi:hypothetical protein
MRFFLQNIWKSLIKLVFLFLLIDLGTGLAGFSQVAKPVYDSSDNTNNTDLPTNISTETRKFSKDSMIIREVPDSTIAAFKKNKDFAYANDPEFLKKEPVNRGRDFGYYFLLFITSKWARAFIYILMAAVLCFAFYKTVVVNKLYLFYSSPKKGIGTGGAKEDIYNEDFDEKINEAFDLQNYRLAIRYMYLKSLRLLDQEGAIQLSAHGTNHGYELQLQDRKFANDFRYLTQVYEYAWYGDFAITEKHAEGITQKFHSFYLSVKS